MTDFFRRLSAPSLLRRLLFSQLLLLALLWWILITVSAWQRVSDETLKAEVEGLRAIALAAAALVDRPDALRAALAELERGHANGEAGDPLSSLRTYTVLHHGDRLLYASPGLSGMALRPHPVGVSGLREPQPTGDERRWRVVTERVPGPDGQPIRASELVPEGPLFWLMAIEQQGGLVLPLLFSMPLLLIPAGLSLHWALRPWRRLSSHLASRDSADLSPLASPGRHRELLPLVDAINAWLKQIRALREREQRFLADAAHELRTPLAAVQLGAQRLQAALAQGDGAQAEAALQAVLRGSARSSRLAHQLLALLRAEAETQNPAERWALAEWLPELIADLAPLAQRSGVQLALLIADPARPHAVQAHADGLHSMLVNLIDNAVRHAPVGSTVEVGLQHEGDRVLISVDDAGPGIPAHQRDDLLQRFRRGRSQEAGSGSGLGLAIAAGVAASLGGSLQLTTSSLGGLRALVVLPAA